MRIGDGDGWRRGAGYCRPGRTRHEPIRANQPVPEQGGVWGWCGERPWFWMQDARRAMQELQGCLPLREGTWTWEFRRAFGPSRRPTRAWKVGSTSCHSAAQLGIGDSSLQCIRLHACLLCFALLCLLARAVSHTAACLPPSLPTRCLNIDICALLSLITPPLLLRGALCCCGYLPCVVAQLQSPSLPPPTVIPAQLSTLLLFLRLGTA